MADDSTATVTATPEGDPTGTVQTPDLGDAGKKALSEERAAKKAAEKKAAELEVRLKAIEDRDKTEAQKLADRAEAAEKAAIENAAQLARYKVAAETAVPAHLLAGADESEIAKHAAELIAWRDSSAPVTSRPSGDVDQGVRTTPLALNGDPLLDSLKTKLGIR
jgi:alanyl-tRNA synthetase